MVRRKAQSRLQKVKMMSRSLRVCHGMGRFGEYHFGMRVASVDMICGKGRFGDPGVDDRHGDLKLGGSLRAGRQLTHAHDLKLKRSLRGTLA